MFQSKPHTAPKLIAVRKGFFLAVPAVLMPVFAFLLVELCLNVFGYGYATDFFIARQVAGRKISFDNARFSQRFFPPQLARPSCRMAIPAEKPSATYRIFVLGGSAAMGDPDFSFGFSRMLEAMLQHEHPEIQFEVFNVAVTAINSNVVLPIARDCAGLQPDLFVVYLGNNEVIGPYGPGTVFAPFQSSLGFIRTSVFLNSTKTVQLLKSLRQEWDSNADEIQAWGGVEMFTENRLRFDDPRMAAVYDHFRENLLDICQVGERAGAKVILSSVATNLQNCAPFGSLHRPDLTDPSLNEWEKHYRLGMDFEAAGRFDAALAPYSQAAAIDDEFADLHYRLARCYRSLGKFDAAQQHYIRARDLDA
ncbi:MAG TPA: tetratricopeptide repeat protein, partial [bacterium]